MTKFELQTTRNSLFASDLSIDIQQAQDNIFSIVNTLYNTTFAIFKKETLKMFSDLEVEYNKIIHRYSDNLVVSIDSLISSKIIANPLIIINNAFSTVKKEAADDYCKYLQDDQDALKNIIIPFIDSILLKYNDPISVISEEDLNAIREIIDINWDDNKVPDIEAQDRLLLSIPSLIVKYIMTRFETIEVPRIRLFAEELLVSSLSGYVINDEIISQFTEYSIAPMTIRTELRKLPKYESSK